MSREINDLFPPLREICAKHISLFQLKVPDVQVVLSFTYRSIAEQDELYALGRDENGAIRDPGKVVTYARGGQSWHNIERSDGLVTVPSALAYDIMLYRNGKALPDKDVAWKELGYLGIKLGLDWGVINKYGSRWDLGHFSFRGSNRITLAEAISGIDPVLSPELVKEYGFGEAQSG